MFKFENIIAKNVRVKGSLRRFRSEKTEVLTCNLYNFYRRLLSIIIHRFADLPSVVGRAKTL